MAVASRSSADAESTRRRDRNAGGRRPSGKLYAIAVVATGVVVLIFGLLITGGSNDSGRSQPARDQADAPSTTLTVPITLAPPSDADVTTTSSVAADPNPNAAPSVPAPDQPVVDALGALGLNARAQPRVYVDGDIGFDQLPPADAAGNGVDYRVPADWYLAADAARRGTEVFSTTDQRLRNEAVALLAPSLLSNWDAAIADGYRDVRARMVNLVLAEPFAAKGTVSTWLGNVVVEPTDGSPATTFIATVTVERQGDSYRLTSANFDPV